MDDNTERGQETDRKLYEYLKALMAQELSAEDIATRAQMDALIAAGHLPDLAQLRKNNPPLFTLYQIRSEPLFQGGGYLPITEVEDAWRQAQRDWQAILAAGKELSRNKTRAERQKIIDGLGLAVGTLGTRMAQELPQTANIYERREFVIRFASEVTEGALPATPIPDDLTNREKEVARLLAQNMDDRLIAQTLVISHRTAKTHRENIAAKWGMESQHIHQMVMEAQRRGYRA